MSEKKAITMNRFYLCLIVAMGVYIFFLQLYRPGCDCEIVAQTIRTNYMKAPKYHRVAQPEVQKEKKPHIREVIAAVTDTVFRIDSSKCVELAEDHLTVREYGEVFRDDTCDVLISFKVKENRAYDLQASYFIKQPFTTIHQEVAKPRVQVFLAGNVGIGFDMSDQNITGFIAGPELIIKDKRGFLYGAGANFNTSGDVYATGKFGFMLSFPRKPLSTTR